MTAATLHGLVRRGLYLYLLSAVLALQGTFLLTTAGLDFEPATMVWVIPLVVPSVLVAWRLHCEWAGLASFGLDPCWLWLGTGLLLFGFWSGGYFLVGLLTDPARVKVLSHVLDRFVPFRPSFVFLYLCVYPVFLLPFFRAARAATIHRLAIGYLVMLLISYGFFLAMPVAFDRPALPQSPPDFSRWTLQIVYGRDPPWNCLPSTHCAVALLAALALFEASRRVGLWGFATAAAIGVSTMYTKQHYVLDVVAGFALAASTYWSLRWIWRNPDRIPERARALIGHDAVAAGTRRSGEGPSSR